MDNNSKRPKQRAFFGMNVCSYLLVIITLLFIPLDAQAESDLQALIDAAPAHSTLTLEAKAYRGPISISKPLTIQGTKGTVMISDTEGFMITDTTQVTLKNIAFQTRLAPIKLTNTTQSTFEHLQWHVLDEGVIIRKATDLTIRNIDIVGVKDVHFSEKANGIASYEVERLVVDNVRATNLQDGLYVERAKDVTVQQTNVTQGRYGLHFMYAEDVSLQQNVVEQNVTGLMLMIIDRLTLQQNIVQKQWALNSNGMYLYDIEQADIRHNTFRENTVGTVWKAVSATSFSQNTFQMNGTAIESEKSPEVHVAGNQFVGNILSARSDSKGFLLQNNMYDDYTGNDFNGDGIGDTHYYALKSFGQWMVRKPVYQYFIESPSVVILNKMDNETQTTDQQLLVDEQPMVMTTSQPISFNIDGWQLLIGTAGISLIWILRRILR